ncbi:hypothetical protein ACVGVM_00295 [Pseudonocardia bannensis]|uniref:Uncharacterized protein n=1 Tax=Pseudonocardia bannensis TaxID=630973 RepID=A0A848DNF9_9PSEU|nr:hypothetical protein [Pseudonocardia bannensis]NMH93961.1 hypothetical protein [Pseudonocardia bannensis]
MVDAPRTPPAPGCALRWPLSALPAVGVLIAVSFGLDSGSPAARDAALLLRAPALWVLLPLVVIWLLVTLVRYLTGRGRAPGPGERPPR